MHTRAAALELGPRGHPRELRLAGADRCARASSTAWPEGVARWHAAAPLERLGEPADVADAVLFLALGGRALDLGREPRRRRRRARAQHVVSARVTRAGGRSRARARSSGGILRRDEERVREQQVGVELERELLRHPRPRRSRPRPARPSPPARGASIHSPTTCERPVAHRARVGVHLGEDRREEAAAREDCRPRRAPGSAPTRARSRSMPVGGGGRRVDHVLRKIAAAVSIVASWSSSFEPKCAKSPLLLMPTASARRAIERPASPSTVASCRRLAEDRVAAPLAVRPLLPLLRTHYALTR